MDAANENSLSLQDSSSEVVLKTADGVRPWVNELHPDPNWTPPKQGEIPPFQYSPMYPVPLSYLNAELSLPLIDEAYDAIEKVLTEAASVVNEDVDSSDSSFPEGRSRKTVRFSRQSTNRAGDFEQVRSGPDTSKFSAAFHNARYFDRIDRATIWSGQSA